MQAVSSVDLLKYFSLKFESVQFMIVYMLFGFRGKRKERIENKNLEFKVFFRLL